MWMDGGREGWRDGGRWGWRDGGRAAMDLQGRQGGREAMGRACPSVRVHIVHEEVEMTDGDAH